MVTLNLAYAEAINPAGATPVLSREQVWRGLSSKIGSPEAFVPVIEGAKILSEKGDVVEREVVFKATATEPAKTVHETVTKFYPARVDFVQPCGTTISNIIADGPGLAETDLQLVFVFQLIMPKVQEGSEEHQKMEKQYVQMAKGAVHGTIEGIRKQNAQ